jgi:hypothetical protein
MPTYVYGCDENKEHPRKEVIHSMAASPTVICGHDGCTSTMHRVPQSMRFYLNPHDVHINWMDENYHRYRARKKGWNRPRFSPEQVNQPGSGLPQKDFNTRKYKKEL